MTATAENIVSALEDAVDRHNWDAADVEIENLSDQFVEALMHGNLAVMRTSVKPVRRLAQRLRANRQLPEEGRELAGQLRALTTILVLSVMRAAAPGFNASMRPVLEVLRNAGTGLSNKQIAEALDQTEETVSRKLPPLRNAGLVSSRRVGKHKLNVLTADGAAALQAPSPHPHGAPGVMRAAALEG